MHLCATMQWCVHPRYDWDAWLVLLRIPSSHPNPRTFPQFVQIWIRGFLVAKKIDLLIIILDWIVQHQISTVICSGIREQKCPSLAPHNSTTQANDGIRGKCRLHSDPREIVALCRLDTSCCVAASVPSNIRVYHKVFLPSVCFTQQ